MTPVDIYSLNGLPAPYWFIQLFKVLGFILHSIPMHLWLTGLPHRKSTRLNSSHTDSSRMPSSA